MVLESKHERDFLAHCRGLGVACVKFADQKHNGAPDRLLLCPGGHAFFIEFKQETGRPRPHQLKYHKALEALGFRVYICYSYQEGVEALDKEMLRVREAR